MRRDLEATREAILAAAEAAFAQHGYGDTSLQQIARAAGVSRGMPNYAFGSKKDLYEAVLDRAFASPQAMIADFSAVAGKDVRQAVAAFVDAFVDYLAARPAYVRLLQRAALDDDGYMTAAAGTTAAVQAGINAAGSLAGVSGMRPFEPRQLVISVIALCFFPFAHQVTLLDPLGLNAQDPRFLADRKAHIIDLLLYGLTASASGSPQHADS
jgi:TetR/AcrR family transcriptional regulator